MFYNDFFSLLTIALCSVGIFCYIYGKRGLELRHLLMIGYLIRVVILLGDYYGWFQVLHSGLDTEMFNEVASNNTRTIAKTYRGGYSHFLTLLYTVTDCSRLIAQYCNVLMGMGVIFITQATMRMLNVKHRNFTIVTLILVFLPNMGIFSAILLREVWVQLSVALSLYYFVKWYQSGKGLYIVLTIASILAGAYMHAGVIVLIAGYSIAFISYNPSVGRVIFSKTSIIALIIIGTMGLAGSAYIDLFIGKFASVEDASALVDATNRVGGGRSDYLTWISTTSITMSLLFAPLKMFYFMFSPLPTEWHGVSDIAGFLIDGVFYMWMVYIIVRHKATDRVNAYLKRYLIICCLAVTFVFAFGTHNAGTAMRHRAKILPIIALAFAVSNFKEGKLE